MQIFGLHVEPAVAARMLCNKHVHKMSLETVQLLCSAIDKYEIVSGFDLSSKFYKPSHPGHPLAWWVAGSTVHFRYAIDLGRALCDEYQARHKNNERIASHDVLDAIDAWFTNHGPPKAMPAGGVTAQAWLDWCESRRPPAKTVTTNKPRQPMFKKLCITTVDPPAGCEFGLICLETAPESRDPDAGTITLPVSWTNAYLTEYAARGVSRMRMAWPDATGMPAALQPHFDVARAEHAKQPRDPLADANRLPVSKRARK